MNLVKIGVVGLGGMGSAHARLLSEGRIKRTELTAVSDQNPDKLRAFPHAAGFASTAALLRDGAIDALIVATPHYDHTTIGIEALGHGVHVLMEKPISVHKADCARLLAAHTNPDQVFGAMFQHRAMPANQKIRAMVRGGELGRVRRVNWTTTTWFRTQAYYASGSWRATWAGEGGGILLNQAPHQLDLYQWIFGLPQRVRGFCHLGRYHDIEVEDDVTAYFEYADGTTATFIVSTGEAPGTNRLEIAAENGRLVYENEQLSFVRNQVPMTQFSRETPEMFASPPKEEVILPAEPPVEGHAVMLQNFVDAILDGTPLIAPAAEGIHSVELANAILYSSLTGQTIHLPLDAAAYERKLNELVKQSRYKPGR